MADWRIMDLGNTPLSFEIARNVLMDPNNATKIFTEAPYINPSGGKAYLFQSPMPLSKLHAKFDPYKFMYLGKGFNKEFAVMKRYYHLKHKRTDLNKQLYNFQRHIYCLATDECDNTSSSLYLVHYFGNDYLLEDAIYRKGAPSVPVSNSSAELNGDDVPSLIPRTTQQSSYSNSTSIVNNISAARADNTSDDEESLPSVLANSKSDNSPSQDYISTSPLVPSARKRKIGNMLFSRPERPSLDKRMSITLNTGKPPAAELDTTDYLFAMNMAARLQQLPDEIKARAKFQIATVFYEAEMKALNCPLND